MMVGERARARARERWIFNNIIRHATVSITDALVFPAQNVVAFQSMSFGYDICLEYCMLCITVYLYFMG